MSKDLLKVLHMSENEQWEWCVWRKNINAVGESLADLAFRLRDEAVRDCKKHNAWCQAKELVWLADAPNAKQYKKLAETYNLSESVNKVIQRREVYFANRAKPIHWIIAALIAKGNHG